MSDLVERLRRGVDTNNPPDKTDAVMADAADEIERLKSEVIAHLYEIKRLQALNEPIWDARNSDEGDVAEHISGKTKPCPSRD